MSDPAIHPRVYVSAVVCGDVIRDKETDLLTAINISSGIVAVPIPLPTREGDKSRLLYHPPVILYLVICICSEFPCTVSLDLKIKRPDGSDIGGETDATGKVKVGGGVDGLTINTQLSIVPQTEGVYWVEVYIDGELSTKLPLMISHKFQEPNRTSSLTTDMGVSGYRH